MKKTLYEHQEGKQMHASGQWSLTKAEQRLIYAVGAIFALSVICVLGGAYAGKSRFLTVSIVCCVISFIALFALLFAVVIRKSKKQPMEKHYYDVDYTYNGITGETDDKTREISREEFRPGSRKK